MKAFIAAAKPILIAVLTSDAAKELLVDILRRVAAKSDNTLDDLAVDQVAKALGVE